MACRFEIGVKMTILEELYKKAEEKGITRADIGKHIWGKNFRRAYLFKNPTAKNLEKIRNGIDEIIAERLKNG